MISYMLTCISRGAVNVMFYFSRFPHRPISKDRRFIFFTLCFAGLACWIFVNDIQSFALIAARPSRLTPKWGC